MATAGVRIHYLFLSLQYLFYKAMKGVDMMPLCKKKHNNKPIFDKR